MWQRLALFCIRRALARLEARVNPTGFERPLSLEIDRLHVALDALERNRIERGEP